MKSRNTLALPQGVLLQGRYLIGRILGVGGFGITYLALDTQTKTRCAVKEYFPKQLAVRESGCTVRANGTATTRSFTHGISMFKNEAETLMKFRGEPLIVQVRDSFQENQTVYFVMEHLDGVNAKALLRSMDGKLPLELSLQILKSVIKALEAIHAQGLLHRDVSPENIFVTRSGQVKLIDFGATRYFVGEISRSLSVILKPGFAPPEQYSSKGHQGPWTDIYALAASFYYLVSGVGVPEAPDRLAGRPLRQLCEIEPSISPQLSGVLDTALALDFRYRYQTVQQFGEALRPLETPQRIGQVAPHQLGENPYLLVLSGKYQGSKWSLPKNMEIIVGRSSTESNIVLDEPNISRVHCSVHFDTEDGCFYVKDFSTNGTYDEKKSRFEQDIRTAVPSESTFSLSRQGITVKVGLE
jgi:serine/threonine protein kinase